MSVETTFVTAIEGDAGVGAQMGDRIYPVRLPGTVTLPAASYRVISRTVIGGTCYRARVQLDLHAATYPALKALRDAVQTLAEGTENWQWIEGPDIEQENEGRWVQIIDLIIT